MVNYTYGQTVITMENSNGVYRIPCVVNGLKMKLIFDTGASKVCISESMAEYMYDNDYLTSDDIKGSGQASVADGRIVNNVNIVLKDIEIGGFHLHNVDAVVMSGQKAPLLLGQTAIQKLGEISIDGNKLTINMPNKRMTDAECKELEREAIECIDDLLYDDGIRKFEIVKSQRRLSLLGYINLAYAYSHKEMFDEAILCILEKRNEAKELMQYYKFNIYDFLGTQCWFSKKFNDAIDYHKKALSYESVENVYKIYANLADDYFWNKMYQLACDNYFYAIKSRADNLSLDINYAIGDVYVTSKKEMKKIKVPKDDALEQYKAKMMICSFYNNDITSRQLYIKLSIMAALGNQYAKRYLNEQGVSWEGVLQNWLY